MTISLPLPPRDLLPNRRGSLWAYRRAAKAYRRDAFFAAKAALHGHTPPQLAHAKVRARYYHRRISDRMDPDNSIACLKPAIDGLVDAGILVDDREITLLPIQRGLDKDHPHLDIEVTPADSREIPMDDPARGSGGAR